MSVRGRILVIEDDSLLAKLMQTILAKANFEVLSVADGEKGLEALDNYQPDLIILDMYLPQLNGWEFCSRYRDRPGAHAPIVATSVEQIDIQPIAGVKEFVRKPFYQSNFLQAIQRSLPDTNKSIMVG